MTYDIVIRSYKKDFKWLVYCLQSITKFCDGFRQVVVVVPDQDKEEIETWNLTKERIVSVHEYGRGYLHQQTSKMLADTFTDADVIMFLDSDCVLTEPLRPEMLYTNGKLTMLITPYTEFPDDFPWQKPTEKALGFPCPFETMRRHPFAYPSKILRECREHVEALHHQDITSYIMSQHAFSEFNVIGSFCREMMPSWFHFIDTTKEPLPNTVLKQYWSHDPKWETIEKEIKVILNAPVEQQCGSS